jgi:hypothetical protein
MKRRGGRIVLIRDAADLNLDSRVDRISHGHCCVLRRSVKASLYDHWQAVPFLSKITVMLPELSGAHLIGHSQASSPDLNV